MYFDNNEMEREAWRHQQCAEYLRAQLVQQQGAGGAPPSQPVQYAAAPAYPGAHDASPSPARQGIEPVRQGNLQDKVWKTFNDLDKNRNGRIEVDEMVQGLHEVNITLTPDTVADLHKKAKQSPAGSPTDVGITNAEWEVFCNRYPMLRDAAYFRFLAKQNADADLRDAQQADAELCRAVQRAKQEFDAADREAGAERNAAGREENALGEAEAAQREADKVRDDAEQGTREATRKRDLAHAKVQREWPVIQKRQQDRYAAQQDAEIARRKISEAEDRERMLQQAMDEARLEKERALAEFRNAQEREMASRPPDGEPDPEEEFHAAERVLGDAHRAEQDARGAQGDSQARTERQRARRDEQDHRAEAAEMKRDAAKGNLDGAQRALDDNTKRMRDAEGTQRNGPGMNPDGSPSEDGRKENDLVVEEIRLREQRDNLEQREGALKDEHNTWSSPRQDQLNQVSMAQRGASHNQPAAAYQSAGSPSPAYQQQYPVVSQPPAPQTAPSGYY